MTKVTQPPIDHDLPEYQRFKAESAEILLSNVSNSHVSPAESEIPPNQERYYRWLDEKIAPNSNPHGKPSPLPPVVGVRLKATTAEVVRASVERSGGGSRGKITEISKSSIKNFIELLANSPVELNSMIVLTYPESFPLDGRICKAHLKAMRQAIKRRFGDFEYGGVQEYQRRGAPHFHIAVNIDLHKLGEVVSLKRGMKNGRRKPAFQTVQEHNDWLFDTWKKIISKPNPRYEGVSLDWSGITSNDAKMMDTAYFEYNSGVSFEVMRDRDGGKKYLIKELSGLKHYQKQVPENFENCGRHFLYSPGMKFDDDNALTFAISEIELREMLQESGWQYLPADDKPLFKRCWNAAAKLAIALIERGAQPVSNSIESLRNYADLRMAHWADKASEQWRYWSQDAELKRYIAGVRHQKAQEKRVINRMNWEFIFSQEPMGP